MRIEIVSGSPRTANLTIRVSKYLQNYLTKHHPEHSIGLIDVLDWKLGFYETAFKTVEDTPEKYKPLTARMFAADAFIIVTPEYNGTYTAEVKNLFDHYSKQGHKAFGIATTSVGPLGGARSTQPILLLVSSISGIPSPSLLIVPTMDKKFNEEGELIDPTYEKQVEVFVREFLWLANRLV